MSSQDQLRAAVGALQSPPYSAQPDPLKGLYFGWLIGTPSAFLTGDRIYVLVKLSEGNGGGYVATDYTTVMDTAHHLGIATSHRRMWALARELGLESSNTIDGFSFVLRFFSLCNLQSAVDRVAAASAAALETLLRERIGPERTEALSAAGKAAASRRLRISSSGRSKKQASKIVFGNCVFTSQRLEKESGNGVSISHGPT